jgi:Nitrile hydratase beta subunit
MDPARYLTASYWERWLDGIVRLLNEKGLVEPWKRAVRTRLAVGP